MHSGKSFLLNRLRGESSGFVVGSTIQPETHGLWAWTEPLQLAQDEATPRTLLLDSEGFFSPGVTETYDALVFSVTTMLSDVLVYNSVRLLEQVRTDHVNSLVVTRF